MDGQVRPGTTSSRALSNWAALIGRDDISAGYAGSRPEVPRDAFSLPPTHLPGRLSTNYAQHEFAKGCAAVAAAMYVFH
jgi:hypothetical protein